MLEHCFRWACAAVWITRISSFSTYMPPIQLYFVPSLIYLVGFAKITAWWCGFRPSQTICQEEGEEKVVVLTCCLKKHMSKCALKSLFYLLVQYFQGAVYYGIFFRSAALHSLLWRNHFISSLDSYILFVLLADPINTHFSLIFKL